MNQPEQNLMPQEPPIVEVRAMSKRYGSLTALDGCSLRIEPGEVFGLLGPNGAGKTTLIRLLLGFLRPTSGAAAIGGYDCYRDRVRVHKIVSYLPGEARLYRMMRGRSVLKLFCGFRDNADLETAQRIADRLELNLAQWVGLMSTGMRQKLALSICFAAPCPVLILDEPTANLDPTIRGQVMEMIREVKREGRTVILCSHILSEIEDTCDRVGIMRRGELVHLESLRSLIRQHRIQARLTGPMPDIPSLLSQRLEVKRVEDSIQIESPGELSEILKWLATAPLTDVTIQSVGLRAIYDSFHHATSIASRTEVNA